MKERCIVCNLTLKQMEFDMLVCKGPDGKTHAPYYLTQKLVDDKDRPEFVNEVKSTEDPY